MTAREVYEYSLIEINKVEAPSLLLADWNYFVNKAITNYSNKRYNLYEVNQQVSDDLHVLKHTAEVTSITTKSGTATFIAELPRDYVHLLNCIAEVTNVLPDNSCRPEDTVVEVGVKRLTANMYSGVLNNYYHKPSFKNPYFYIHDSGDRVLPASDSEFSQAAGTRTANARTIKVEIRCGKTNPKYAVTKVTVDYLRAPQLIRLTEDQIDQDVDTSQTIEFPDYVIHEIIKELVSLLMENSSDPRLNTNIPINATIPSGQQEQSRRGRR